MIGQRIRDILGNAAIWFAVVFFLFPTIWVYMTAFKPPAEYYASPPKLFPDNPTVIHFYEAFYPEAIDRLYSEGQAYWVEEAAGRANPVTPALVNSIVVTLGATIASLLIGIPAAYALSRYKFRGAQDIAVWLLSTRMVPPIVMVIPFFFIIQSLNLIDTWSGLILIYIMINLPVVVWILKGVFDEVPVALEEAALVDGANRATAFVRVVFPLAIGGIVAAALFCIFLTWNEFLFATLLTRNEAATLPVALSTFRQDRGLLWGTMSATIVIATLPVIAIIFVLQRRVVQGLLSGSLK